MLRFINCWKESPNSEIPLYSWLQFIAAKGHRLKSAKGTGAWGGVQGKPGGGSQLSSSGGVPWTEPTPPAMMCSNTHAELPTGKLAQALVSRVFIGGPPRGCE